ncbi:ubinuclein-1 isoform X2 [Camellia sinensis]|uniref:ubinuclein-1 isoform X2 n=1 Tax=Camellia sinensis TaxID=4442 RepID=UPI0010362A12|nr:ubinuclein-1 isoform X2 [Camellia sinensis]
MEEAKAGAGESVRASSSLVAVGGRQRFTVELRPGETTIVSWKKLAKDVSKVNRPTSSAPAPAPAPAPEPQSNAHSVLESRLAPGQPSEIDLNDAPPTSRFSAVIEKIERLYMGKHSSDEEDLNDVPDDDEYDTEDSFIDDAELDEYFQVDNSTIKHDGFFVNRGKLERTNEPTLLSNQQPKKRRRKDLAKGQGEGDDDHMPNKHVKVGKKVAGKSVPLVGKNSSGHSHIVALPIVHHEDTKFQNQMNSSVICAKKKSAETKTLLDPSPPSKVPNGDASLSIPEEKDIDKQKTGMASSKYQGNKLKDGGEFSDPSVQRSHGKSSYTQSKSQPGKLLNNVNESDQSVQRREKDGIRERPDLNVYEGKYPMQTVAPLMQRKEGLNVRPKSTMLEKAIRELEKMVAESRPPTMEVQDADISSQAVKRRLPHEVKQKLAKVARLAQANHGKISMELVNRLMSIVGHMVQLRTLKRNLKVMVNMGLSAKKEKDDRFQLMKKEVAELIRMRVPYIKSKALEQQAGASDDFLEIGNEEKDVIKRKYSMDDALEDKICDLYDLYIEGLDDDAGPQVRKLYAELAELWPDGFMDNHGIKRAICRAKDRKRPLHSHHKEKIRRKKLIPKTEEAVRVETTTTAQPQYVQEKLVTDSGNHGLTSVSRPMPNSTTANTNVWMPMPSATMNGPNLDRLKQDEVKVTSSNLNDTRTMDALTKKKVKRKPELESSETHFHLEKLVSAQGKERHKPHKHVTGPIRKPSLLLAPLPPQNFERPS